MYYLQLHGRAVKIIITNSMIVSNVQKNVMTPVQELHVWLIIIGLSGNYNLPHKYNVNNMLNLQFIKL